MLMLPFDGNIFWYILWGKIEIRPHPATLLQIPCEFMLFSKGIFVQDDDF